MPPSPIHLFPITELKSGFTTCPALKMQNVVNVPFDDKDLGIHKNTGTLSHDIVTPPAPTKTIPTEPSPQRAWEAKYPKGSISPKTELPGGMGFYMSGPPNFAKMLDAGATDVLFSYRVMFNHDWEWVKGGKLPGAYGGVGDLAYRCSGGRKDDRCKCFNFRLMWRAGGKGEIYAYVPLNKTNDDRLLSHPLSKRNNDFSGISVGRGAFTFQKGIWTTVAERIKLNSPNKSDGEIQLWINGECVLHITGLILREEEASHIKGMHFQTFFGGKTPEWASPKDQKAWFADVSGGIIQ
ncbi:polysaccharide lyase family 14 protein [Hygrophoropsis aurantiaca]|uniref:Polysaccharide lyase family 14 protein n=1 Tax=Hygrophoropsis aurantiaca TaxID=72124 RepID=A0ACB8AGK4_9AGAM|nr:polysaccharide lyase family 14 protein [Hygrophoropsis aurantiaca]